MPLLIYIFPYKKFKMMIEQNGEKTQPNSNDIEPKQSVTTNSSVLDNSENNEKTTVSLEGRIKTKDVTNTKGQNFEDYGLKKELLKGIYEKGFDFPSPIQEEVIPVALTGQSVIARAKNGTGKTGSFAIPVLANLDSGCKFTQSLILVPTRELALQTSGIIRELGRYLNVRCEAVTGGTNVKEDIRRIRENNPVQVLIGTPGRVYDLVLKKAIDLSECRMLVLDEADKLISSDFNKSLERIINHLPEKCQIMLFSATFPVEIKQFQDKYLKDAVEKNLMDELTLVGVTQYYTYLEEKDKLHCLHTLFQKLEINQVIIFCNTTKRVELLTKKIIEMGFSCFYIHAKMEQKDRNKVYYDYRNNACRCLVSSDLMTRGIDVPNVNLVINFDFPKAPETYLHRIGRSGRFGHLGLAISFITEGDVENFYNIQKDLDTVIELMPQNVDRNKYMV